MRKSVGLVLVFVFLAACMIVTMPTSASAEETENTWVSKAPMQVARNGLSVAVVNGKIYAIGGSTAQGSPTDSIGGIVGTNEEYNPETDTWAFKASMPTARFAFTTAVYQNKIYCIGGSTKEGRTGINEVYDPATDTWENQTSMPTPRSALHASTVNGKIYLVGGLVDSNSDSGASISALNEVYDPATDSWTTKASMPTGAADYASAVFSGKIYVVGGLSEIPQSNLNQIYNPEADTWSQGAKSPSGIRDGAAAATAESHTLKRIYVFGITWHLWESEPPYSARVYDPKSDNWTFGVDIPTERHYFGVAVVNDMLYVIGGSTMTYPTIQSWSAGGYVTKYSTNERYTPFGYGIVPSVVSPETNRTYVGSDVPLMFTLGKPASWMGYSLDGRDNVTIAGNTTLTELPNGAHNLTVYATAEFENTGASETVYFNIDVPEPFSTAPVAAGAVALTVVGVGLLVYFKKRRR